MRLNRTREVAALILALALIPTPIRADDAAPAPPVAKKVPKVTEMHGDRRVDDYDWLREKTNPEVIAYLEAENAYAAAVMKPTEAFQEELYKEILGRIKQTDLSVPYRLRGYYHYTRTEEGKQYSIYCRKKGSLEAPEEVTLDVNELAKGEKFMALGAYAISDDDNLLAYSTDNTGFRQYTLRLKDLRTGQLLPDKVEKVVSVVWAADNRTLFYTTEDSAKRSYRLWRHRLGEAEDQLVYEEKDEMFRIGICRPRSPRANGSWSRRASASTSTTWITAATSSTSARTPAGATSAW
jgi:oligopeptidase B